MAPLAAALARNGCKVTYVAEKVMSDDRAKQGWSCPELGRAHLELAPRAEDVELLVRLAPVDAVHICQGIRANGLVRTAQRSLTERRLRYWVVMETVDNSGWRGFLKRLEYTRLILQRRKGVEGILAIGKDTNKWVVDRGMPQQKVFPFAYFLPDEIPQREWFSECQTGRFQLIFVGQFIELKRLDLLITSLARLGRSDVELTVVGSGCLEEELRSAAEAALPGRVRWLGRISSDKVQQVIAGADCLVLPSKHDGWGAVVSEALMVGTPVICSDACGAAEVVRASRTGGIFRSGNRLQLSQLLEAIIDTGRQSRQARAGLAAWAKSLGAGVGASYFLGLLDHSRNGGTRPIPPWEATSLYAPLDE